MILLAHAYSRNNSGDGLLVDASLKLIREAFPDEGEIVVAALDPGSFPELTTIPIVGGSGPAARRALSAAGVALRLASRPALGRLYLPGFSESARRARLIVGVGGGYMRADGCLGGAKAVLAQASQALAAADSGRPIVYLPQSVGPFDPPFGTFVRRALERIPLVFVRDDRSLATLADSTNLRRAPDLAILELFADGRVPATNPRYAKTYLVVREINGSAKTKRDYRDRLRRLRELIPGIEPVIQSRGRNNDDATFYRRLGWGNAFRSVAEAVRTEPGVVVSVRLHGALQSIIAGCPAVHLSYERKGWGAYSDLGISPYVHNVRAFEPELVSRQVRDLLNDASEFWSAVNAAAGMARRARTEIIAALRQAAGPNTE